MHVGTMGFKPNVSLDQMSVTRSEEHGSALGALISSTWEFLVNKLFGVGLLLGKA